VRQGGSWIVLGVGPGKTTRVVETASPVDSILAERGAKHINVNLLRYFSEPATLDDEAKTFLQRGMALAMEWAVQGLVVPQCWQDYRQHRRGDQCRAAVAEVGLWHAGQGGGDRRSRLGGGKLKSARERGRARWRGSRWITRRQNARE